MEKKQAYQCTEEEALLEQGSRRTGLSRQEAQKRLEQYGRNQLAEEGKKGILILFLEQFKDFLVFILFAAAAVSFFLGDLESAGVIAAVLILNAILGTIQNVKAEQSLQGLKALSAPEAKVLRNGEKETIKKEEVTLGDILLLEAGDYICADGRVLENFSLQVNESSLTGESISAEKDTEALSDTVPLGDRKNMVFSGSFVTYGRANVLVTAIGMETELGHVAGLLKQAEAKKTPLQVSLDDFGRKLSVLILIVCAAVFGLNLLRGGKVLDAFLFAVALAVAAIPEALSSIVTIVLAFGTQKMAKENAIIRKLHAVEGLGSVSVICSDKTGTLTQNKMTVQKYAVDTEVIAAEEGDFTRALERKLLLFSILCNDAGNQRGKEIGDPTEVALINYGDRQGFEDTEVKKEYPRYGEIPFDSDRKLMSTVYLFDEKRTLITKGAVDVLLERTDKIERADGVYPFTVEDKQRILDKNKEFSEEGLRVLAFGYRTISEVQEITKEMEQGYTFVGLIAMMDPPREESKQAVSDCIAAGIRPVMITGDHKITASAIAKRIGILKEGEKAVDGVFLDTLTEEELQQNVPQISVYARVSPEHKIRIVKAWQARGSIVAMTGDGVNDAPALRQADIGVAMGITGSEAAKDAAAMVLADDNFATIVKAVENGRNLYQNIKNAIQFLLSGNTAAILVVVFASIFGLPVPFAPVHLLFINLLTDSLPAIALGLEPHTQGVMKEPPRKTAEGILTKAYLWEILLEGTVISIATATAFLLGLQQDAKTASTLAFSVLCLSRLFHGFNCKGKEPVLWSKKLFNNKYLWAAFFTGFCLLHAVLFFPPFHSIFSVVSLHGKNLLYLYGLPVLTLLIIQTIKLFHNGEKKA